MLELPFQILASVPRRAHGAPRYSDCEGPQTSISSHDIYEQTDGSVAATRLLHYLRHRNPSRRGDYLGFCDHQNQCAALLMVISKGISMISPWKTFRDAPPKLASLNRWSCSIDSALHPYPSLENIVARPRSRRYPTQAPSLRSRSKVAPMPGCYHRNSWVVHRNLVHHSCTVGVKPLTFIGK